MTEDEQYTVAVSTTTLCFIGTPFVFLGCMAIADIWPWTPYLMGATVIVPFVGALLWNATLPLRKS